MKIFKALIVSVVFMFGLVSIADAASRVSSRSSSFSSRSYSSPKSYSAPKSSGSVSSKPTLKSLGFSKPAAVQTAPRSVVNVSPKPQKTTTSSGGGWFSKRSVSSTPTTTTTYKPAPRVVSSPVSYKRNVTVVQKNYYGGYNGNGYNRGYSYGQPNYGNHYYSGSSGFGSSFAGTLGGMAVYHALTSGGSHNSGATAAQIEQAKQDQRIEDKLDALKDNQDRNSYAAVQQPVMQAPQCLLPPDAPLMMSPSFYCK